MAITKKHDRKNRRSVPRKNREPLQARRARQALARAEKRVDKLQGELEVARKEVARNKAKIRDTLGYDSDEISEAESRQTVSLPGDDSDEISEAESRQTVHPPGE